MFSYGVFFRFPSLLKPRHAGLLAFLFILNACAVGKDYVPPREKVGDRWDALALYNKASGKRNDPEIERLNNIVSSSGISISNNGTLPTGPWWKQFGDETLSRLVENALAENHDLKTAQARIAEARADEYFATSQLFPQISATGNVTRATQSSIYSTKPDTITQEGLSGNWDLDVFGVNRRRREAAIAFIEATQNDFAQAKLNLIADVARNYSHLRASQQLRILTWRNLATQRDTLKVTMALRKAQDVTDLDVMRVEAQIASTESRLPQIRTDIRAAIHRLSILTGQAPSALNDMLKNTTPMLTIPDQVVVLSPIDTIAHRPDIHAAERRLAQASALTSAAFAGFFPDVSINAFFGKERSYAFGPLSPIWNATAGAAVPLLDFGRVSSQLHSADARQQQAFHIYKQTVLLALEDTENNLDAYIDERYRSVLLHEVVVKQARAVAIAREQYRAGIVTQLDLLDAERNLLDSESNWVLSLQAKADDIIQLYHALGME